MLAGLREGFAQEGLHVVRPFTQVALDRLGVSFSLAEVLPGAQAGLIVGDGGGEFFSRFSSRVSGAAAAARDPLDGYTQEVVTRVLARAGLASAVRFPFDVVPLPMQRLGEAAGLPPAGPLGIQIHPHFGPWWAYRAVVVLTHALPEASALPSPCQGCPAPCVQACPGHAVRPPANGGFHIGACAGHRLAHAPCQLSCLARKACVVGPAQAYPAPQLAFHMHASLVMIRAHQARGAGGG